MLYFAYGSNLNEKDRRRWCRERGHDDFVEAVLGPAWLPDHQLAFHYRSKARGGGALDIQAQLGKAVAGALCEIRPDAWPLLDRKEGRGRNYERCTLQVIDHHGALRQAVSYKVLSARRESSFVTPAPGYAELAEAGLKALKMPTSGLHAAASNHPTTLPRWLFVYGSLRAGASNHWRLKTQAKLEAARCPGQLRSLGRYPGLIPGAPDEWVLGEVLETPAPGLLKELDDYEEFKGYEHRDCEFQRLICAIETSEGPDYAWVYVYKGEDPGQAVPGGDWLKDWKAHRGS